MSCKKAPHNYIGEGEESHAPSILFHHAQTSQLRIVSLVAAELELVAGFNDWMSAAVQVDTAPPTVSGSELLASCHHIAASTLPHKHTAMETVGRRGEGRQKGKGRGWRRGEHLVSHLYSLDFHKGLSPP